MWAGCIACPGLSLWQLSEATLRARPLPRRERLGKLVSSGFLFFAYGSVGLSFAGFALGNRGDSGELRHFEGSRRGRLISGLGVAGHVAKGVALILTGLLFVIAAATNDPGSSTGLDRSPKSLQDHPFGPVLLAAIGACFIAYGAFTLIGRASAGCCPTPPPWPAACGLLLVAAGPVSASLLLLTTTTAVQPS